LYDVEDGADNPNGYYEVDPTYRVARLGSGYIYNPRAFNLTATGDILVASRHTGTTFISEGYAQGGSLVEITPGGTATMIVHDPDNQEFSGVAILPWSGDICVNPSIADFDDDCDVDTDDLAKFSEFWLTDTLPPYSN